MEYVKIKAIAESDFDSVVEAAGGTRIPEIGSADYLLDEAVIELKFVEEEGFDKENRRKKVAELFRKRQPTLPVVVIDPEMLDGDATREYYNIVSGPIKTHVKKAASQLDATRLRINTELVRVLVIVNVGYTALSEKEFKYICVKCVHNDTSKIDWIVCGGIYFYSDKFDFYVIAPLEGVAVDVTKPFPSLALLQSTWGKMLNTFLAPPHMLMASSDEGKMPVMDLVFDLDGIRYVKTSLKMPKSEFWPSGKAPRENSSGISSNPYVAVAFPKLMESDWALFKQALRNGQNLAYTYVQWLALQYSEDSKYTDKLKPFVPTPVTYRDFVAWTKKPKSDWSFRDLCEFATETFQVKAFQIFDGLKNKDDVAILPLEYIHLIVKEIGMDQANDLSSIIYKSHVVGFEREEIIIDNGRLFFEYGVCLAGAYAVKRGGDTVLYTKLEA